MFMNPPNENTSSNGDGKNDHNLVYKTPTHKHLPKIGRTTLLCMMFQPLVQAFITMHTVDWELLAGKIFR